MGNAKIGTIYCLNHGPDSVTRQRNHNEETDPQLPTVFPKNVVFLEGDLAHHVFQLENNVFEAMLSSVAAIIHNAWSVDFNRSLSSFTQHLLGVENLLYFLREAHNNPQSCLSLLSALL
jgi:thioester reductase-like protein